MLQDLEMGKELSEGKAGEEGGKVRMSYGGGRLGHGEEILCSRRRMKKEEGLAMAEERRSEEEEEERFEEEAICRL